MNNTGKNEKTTMPYNTLSEPGVVTVVHSTNGHPTPSFPYIQEVQITNSTSNVPNVPQPVTLTADNYMTAVYGKNVEPDVFYFNDATIRRAFIKKVFSIVAIQLAITMTMTCWFIFETHTKRFVQHHLELFIIAFVLEIVVLIALICFGELRRRAPANFILLIIFTVAHSFFIAVVATCYDVMAVAIALGFTVLVCTALVLFAFQTKWDFTMMGGALYVTLLIFIFTGFISIWLWSNIAQVLYASVGAIIFSLYLVYDIQLMIGGGHRYQISPEEYVFAALNIFIDITRIFIYILRIVGISR